MRSKADTVYDAVSSNALAVAVGIPEAVGVAAGSPAAALPPLTISNISVQRPKKSVIDLQGERWHTKQFRLSALQYETFVFKYMGVDWLGNIQSCCNHLCPRWSSYRQKYTLGRIYSWAETAALDNALFDKPLPVAHLVTLTVRHDTSGSYRSHKETVDKLRRGWSCIRCWLSRSGVRYLRVIEPGEKNGYPHIHMILIGASDEFCKELVSRWLNASPDSLRRGQDWQRVEDIRRVGAYVAKYLSKTVDRRDCPEYWRWMELCYRTRLRCFAMDARSSRYIKKKYSSKPSGVGVCEIDRNTQLKEKDVNEGASQNERPSGDVSTSRGRSVLCRSRWEEGDHGCPPYRPSLAGGVGGSSPPAS